MKNRLTYSLCFAALISASACSADTSSDMQEVAEETKAVTATMELKAAKPFTAPDDAWRSLDPENTLYVDTAHGRIVVELYPEVAPAHVTQIKTLARKKFYDYITFHRVIEDFMNQTGDPKGDGTGDSDLPNVPAEFTFRRSPAMKVTLTGARSLLPGNPNSPQVGVGFYNSLPVATQPAAQAMATKDGKVEAYGLHCKGVTSMARSSDPNSGNSQFFLMRGMAPHLDRQYSIWGTTVYGRENLTKIKVGTKGETANFVPDQMEKVRVVADLPESEQLPIQVLRTDSPAFKNYLKTLKGEDGEFPDICDIEIPSRLNQ